MQSDWYVGNISSSLKHSGERVTARKGLYTLKSISSTGTDLNSRLKSFE